MALIRCPGCAKEVSDLAVSCGGCGRQIYGAPAPADPVAARVSEQLSRQGGGAAAGSRAPHLVAIVLGLIGLSIAVGFGPLAPTAAPPVSSTPDSPPAPVVPNEPDDAKDIVATLTALHPIACAANAAEWAWATCADETVGYNATARCIAESARVGHAAFAAIPAQSVASSACGRELEQTLREHVVAEASFLDAENAWIQRAKPGVRAALSRQPLSDACRSITCQEEPFPDPENFPGIHFGGGIDRIKCVEAALTCRWQSREPIPCNAARAASLLGISCGSGGGSAQPIFSRRTGRPVE
jgi:hypothetical protein